MRLKIIGLENEISFTDDKNTVLVIENYIVLGNTIKIMNDIVHYGIDSNEIVLLHNGDNILSKANLVLDPFNININAKVILKELYKQIESNFQVDETLHEFYNGIVHINNIIDDVLQEYNVDFEYNDDTDVQSYLKLINLKIVDLHNLSLYDQIINYLEVISELLPSQPIIFYNLLSYLSDEQIKMLCNFKNYNHLFVLFIESKDRELKDFIKYHVDDDFFESIC